MSIPFQSLGMPRQANGYKLASAEHFPHLSSLAQASPAMGVLQPSPLAANWGLAKGGSHPSFRCHGARKTRRSHLFQTCLIMGWTCGAKVAESVECSRNSLTEWLSRCKTSLRTNPNQKQLYSAGACKFNPPSSKNQIARNLCFPLWLPHFPNDLELEEKRRAFPASTRTPRGLPGCSSCFSSDTTKEPFGMLKQGRSRWCPSASTLFSMEHFSHGPGRRSPCTVSSPDRARSTARSSRSHDTTCIGSASCPGFGQNWSVC